MYEWLLRAYRVLVWEPRHVLGSVLVPSLLFAFVLRYPPFGGDALQRWSWACALLEILGTLVVVVGLLDRRRLFGTRPVAVAFANWLERVECLLVPQHSQTQKAISGVVNASVAFTGSAKLSIRDSSLEDRLRRLEVRMHSLSNEMTSLRSSFSSAIEEARAEALHSDRGIQRELQELAYRTRQLSVGSLGFELMGLAWLLSGIALGAWPSLALRIASSAA